MGSVSSEDVSERCGSYSPSADISESESSSSFYGRRFDAEGASSSVNLSPRQRRAFQLTDGGASHASGHRW
ncbi:unnamed protein product [Lathyrus sativus]|nr:unnamed protein product [Lathyrus sativus]